MRKKKERGELMENPQENFVLPMGERGAQRVPPVGGRTTPPKLYPQLWKTM